MSNPRDVVIAGAGPVGLMLACELGLAGVSVLVLEKAEDPASPLKGPPFGMRGLTIPTIDIFQRRGLLDEIAGPPVTRAGHFAGIPLEPAPARAATMEKIETVLANRASSLGVEIRRGLDVEAFEASDEEVAIQAAGQTFRGRWLVGCDGGRSRVRKLAGFDFTGTEPEFTGYSVQVSLSDPDQLPLGRHYTATGMYFHSQTGTIALVLFDGGASHRSQPLTPDSVQAVLRHVSGADVTVTALHLATTWTDRAYQVSDYRRGRVLLAGDAAHIHSPLGGQGLNLGLGDAMDLGWKLAATIRGEAAEDLLDSYSRDRHAVAAAVLDWSRAQVLLMRPDPASRAMAAIVRDLIGTRDGAAYFAARNQASR